MGEFVMPGYLNEYQRKAVLDKSSACLVNANVGSGKTTVLTVKIRYLHESADISYRDMVVLTFTNKAANEIKERLAASEEASNLPDMRYFGTFHSVALQLLREVLPVGQLGYTSDFQVMDPEEELDLALELIRERKLQIKYKNRLKKRLEQETAGTPGRNSSRIQDDMPLLQEALKEEKKKRDRMSFSDLLFNTEQLLEGTEWKPQWVIIDEVQDCDALQLRLIQRLVDKGASLFAVGDPNQVIYSWRGSACNVFYTLRSAYDAVELSLPVNYRSSETILQAAGAFAQNGGGFTGSRQGGNKIVVKNHYDPFQEACYLADRIRGLVQEGIPFRQIAVFYRLQNQSGVLEEVFAQNGIPFQVSVKRTIRDIPVLYWMLQVLRFSLNPKDRGAGIYALSHKEYGERRAGKPLSEKAASSILKEEKTEGCPLYERMTGFLEACPEIDSPEALYSYFDLDSYIHPTSRTWQEDRDSLLMLFQTAFETLPFRENAPLHGNVLRQGNDLLHGESPQPEGEGQTDLESAWRAFLNTSVLYGIPVKKEDEEVDGVRLMTLHASKGLEFSHVFIVGVNYGLIPLRTRDFEEEDEERRLFFVGMTRAKDYLELSFYTNPESRVMPGESRFLRMIPQALVENDAAGGAENDLQTLKKMILEERAAGESAKTPEPKEEAPQERYITHRKYGKGKVVAEDEAVLTAEFPGYGEKEFLKAFCGMEYTEGSGD